MKIGNFGRLDPTLKAKDITGLEHGSSAEEPIWKEFWGNLDKLAFESERLFAEKAGKKVEDTLGADIHGVTQLHSYAVSFTIGEVLRRAKRADLERHFLMHIYVILYYIKFFFLPKPHSNFTLCHCATVPLCNCVV